MTYNGLYTIQSNQTKPRKKLTQLLPRCQTTQFSPFIEAFLTLLLSSYEIEKVTRDQILNEVVSILLHTNALGKGLNLSLHFTARGK